MGGRCARRVHRVERSSEGKNANAGDGMRRVKEGTIEFKDWMKPPSCQMLGLGLSV